MIGAITGEGWSGVDYSSLTPPRSWIERRWESVPYTSYPQFKTTTAFGGIPVNKMSRLITLLAALFAANAWAAVLDFRTEGLGGQGTVINGDEWLDIGIELSTPDTVIEVGCGGGALACVGASVSPGDFEGRLVVRFVQANTTNQSSSVNVNVDFCCESNQGSTDSTLFDVNGQVITTFIDQDIAYQGGTPVGWIEVDFGFDAINVIEFDDQPIAVPDRATFTVTKEFSDNNVSPVTVQLSCNTGLPLEQSFVIVDDDSTAPLFSSVTFVVTDFEDGEMNCTVTEDPVDGYSASYSAAGTSQNAVDEGCQFFSIAHGHRNACRITNSLDQVEVEVTKMWIDENPQFNAQYIANAEWACSGLSDVCEGAGGCNTSGFLHFNGNPDTEKFFVFPDWDIGTKCSITEVDVLESGIEVDDSECQDLVVFPGTGASCMIFNTRLHEGIPTLSQYGLALLVLLTLGVGLAGVRRFA